MRTFSADLNAHEQIGISEVDSSRKAISVKNLPLTLEAGQVTSSGQADELHLEDAACGLGGSPNVEDLPQLSRSSASPTRATSQTPPRPLRIRQSTPVRALESDLE
jgi:hypothetical protein